MVFLFNPYSERVFINSSQSSIEIGSAPFVTSLTFDKSQSFATSLLKNLRKCLYPKLGEYSIVALCWLAFLIHKTGYLINNCVCMLYWFIPRKTLTICTPTNPISCVRGIQLSVESPLLVCARSAIAVILVRTFLCDITTPLGSPVEPEEN
ncbi:MAG: hypothetical protein BWY74_04520 [Firmicutes bacterium ADurb.Bin419]|nr:MAG: hypothetical protein BWY74_04520 [Firmicutes bacterium ADurb.Bin419]